MPRLRLADALVPTLGGLVGCVAFASSLGLVLADPRRYEWLLRGDWAVHFLGWHLFRRGPWTWPLGASPLLGWPVGTSVGLTDSLPVFAIPFKMIDRLIQSDFQYIGLWLLLCFVLQGVFGALLMRLATPRPALQVLGATLFVMSPVLLWRTGHPALTAHWLLLAGLWLYFRTGAERPSTTSLVAWIVVAGVAAGTHPYLAFMTLMLAGAAHARQIVVDPSNALRVIAYGGMVVTCAGLVLWQSGYFVVEGADGLQVGGFGNYSMNLLAPIMPMQSSRVFGHGPFSYATLGQYEGYAYLGAGLLLLGAFALTVALVQLARPRAGAFRGWQHVPFVVTCMLLTLLALSPTVTMGSRTLFTYDPHWWGPLSVFRASGRMFWPVYYAMAFAILTAVARLDFKRGLPLMLVAVLLQGADLSDTYRGLQQVRLFRARNELESRFWQVVPRHYRRLTLLPTNICATSGFVEYLQFSLVAGRHGLSINAGTAARYDVREVMTYCNSLSDELRSGTISSDDLYVLQPYLVPQFKARARTPVLCTTIDNHEVCVATETYLRWQDDYDIMLSVFPSPAELLAFYDDLDLEYRDRLHRTERTVNASREERFTALTRYLWYRRTRCEQNEAAEKILRTVRGQQELRLCGDPAALQPMPPPDQTFAFWKQLESMYQSRSGGPTSTTHVDSEGEAVWLHRYIDERFRGRDAYGARVEVLNAIRAMPPPGG